MDDLTNEVVLASTAIEQLPKILFALSNMARRSRQQLQRKGIYLGGLWYSQDNLSRERSKGILKSSNGKRPSLSRLSTYNDIWKAVHFNFQKYESYPFQGTFKICKDQNIKKSSISWTSRQTTEKIVDRLDQQFLLMPLPFPEPKCLPIIQRILQNHLKYEFLNAEEREILAQLNYFRTISNIPLYKLLRGKPREFVLPLPRRPTRGVISSTPHSRALVAFQCVSNLPKIDVDSKTKWYSFGSSSNANKFHYTEYADDAYLIRAMQRKHLPKCGRIRYSTVFPKGAAFLTYPDSMDETSFEGTIGGRNLISWEKGTKFPQMGLDQSSDFKSRRELSRQHMIQRRLHGAKFQRRMTYRVNDANSAKRNPLTLSKTIKKMLPKNLFKGILIPGKVNIRKSGHSRRRNVISSVAIAAQQGDGKLKISNASSDETERLRMRKSAEKAERRKRIKLYTMRVLKYLSCGIVPYIMTGECRVFRSKRRVRTIDSRENCPSQ